ncbi:MAG TPA: ABC transporter substrate-binding protein [Buttiauxella sp.]|uniref:ABC transporter substrate-binding protein n=1 Tax=Buttiauxella sp. TaxID=1972222 RepID=UPI002B488C99|nr:ABC transporter substrate-binding protein [Buttiauxella sp.]HKM96673.1 ABC transporter substrate-binding protein [Buttiauxella sp.]
MKHWIVAGLALALWGNAVQAEVTLRIGDQKGGMRSQLDAAGKLEDLPYKIEWSEFPAAAPLAEALNAGAIDVGIIGDAPLLFAVAAGAQAKAIAVSKADAYGTALLVRPDSPVKSAADLKGKSIATNRGSIGHFVALKALASAGLSAKDVTFRFLPPSEAKLALIQGSVDVWATWEPYTAYAESVDKLRVAVNGRGLWSGNSFLAATDSALADLEKKAAITDYLQRLNAAQIWANQHPDIYGKALAKIIGFPEDVARLSFERRHPVWQTINDATVTQQQQTADFYYASELLPKTIQVIPTFSHAFQVN